MAASTTTLAALAAGTCTAEEFSEARVPAAVRAGYLLHPLPDRFCLYTADCRRGWTDKMTMHCAFDTVEALVQVDKALGVAGIDYYVFREHVRPTWEDPANSGAGRMRTSIEGDKSDVAMIVARNIINDLCCGEFDPCACGVAITARRGVNIALWITDPSRVDTIKQQLDARTAHHRAGLAAELAAAPAAQHAFLTRAAACAPSYTYQTHEEPERYRKRR